MTAEAIDMATGEVVANGVINYQVHPVAAIFPLMEGEPFRDLKEDIRLHGQREPVVLDKHNQLIDGRNRARGCQELGVDVKESRYEGDDVEAWIISHNLHRRHLTESQRSMVAARYANLQRGQFHGNQYTGGADQLIDTTSQPTSSRDAAEALNIGEASVNRARAVIKSGDDELINSVESGKTSVTKAAKQAREKTEAEKPSPTPKPSQAKPAPKKGGNPRNRRKHRQIIEQISISLSGLAIAADEIAELDATVTAEEAAQLHGDLSKSIKSLNKINALLKERTK